MKGIDDALQHFHSLTWASNSRFTQAPLSAQSQLCTRFTEYCFTLCTQIYSMELFYLSTWPAIPGLKCPGCMYILTRESGTNVPSSFRRYILDSMLSHQYNYNSLQLRS